MPGAKILLGRLVTVAASRGFPLVVPVDETVERRKGKRIKAKGRHRDAVRSTQGEVVKCWGLKWIGLWHTPGQEPVRLRWVLVVDPAGENRPQAFFATDDGLAPERIVEVVVLRWNVEVTFEETQRQWSDRAIARTIPALMGLFSLVCLMALRLFGEGVMPVRQAAWYQKQDTTFSDVLAFVRCALWVKRYFVNSESDGEWLALSPRDCEALLHQLAATA